MAVMVGFEWVYYRMLNQTVEIHAAGVRDAAGVDAQPGAVLVDGGRIVAAGQPAEVARAAEGLSPRRVDMPGHLIVPATVNAHVHLDLTTLGRWDYEGAFVDWVGRVMANAPREEAAVYAAVAQGAALCREAGVGYVGDIASSAYAAKALAVECSKGVSGVSFLECFGIGSRAGAAAEELGSSVERLIDETVSDVKRAGEWCLGVQPHAPYSAGLAVYEKAMALAGELGLPLSTHLAETLDELEFVREATGQFAELLRKIGKWDDTIVGTGLHPVDYLGNVMQDARWLLAHCNYVEDEQIELLARCGASVAYCPIASEYFGHRDHRYHDMMKAGVNVCLGTDSMVCQPVDEAYPLGIWPQMRRLHERDGVGVDVLLRMATVNGALALGLGELAATLQAGAPAKLMAIEVDAQSDRDLLSQAIFKQGVGCRV